METPLYEEVLLEKIKERWLGILCAQNCDTYFFVGNMKRFRQNFMILGVFTHRDVFLFYRLFAELRRVDLEESEYSVNFIRCTVGASIPEEVVAVSI